MEHKDELRSVQLQDLRSRIDRALGEAERGEGAGGEQFMQRLLDDLDASEAGRKAG